MKKTFLILLTILGCGALLSAQDLKPSDKLPAIDGSLASAEYQQAKTIGGVTVALTLGSDKQLYLAIQAKTTGWVALGTGTGRMDGSNLFLAVLADGKPVLSEQLGKGHSHGDAPGSLVSNWKLVVADGVSTLELSLPADKVTSAGKLNLLWAYGNTTDLKARHAARGSLSFSVPTP
jgi:hypothetical protein